MLLTAKLRIYPTEAQAEILWALAERCRLLYNFALQERRTIWKANKDKPKADRQKITYLDQQNRLPALKKEFPEYRWVYSKVLQMTLRKLDAAYKSYFALRQHGDECARPPSFEARSIFSRSVTIKAGSKLPKALSSSPTSIPPSCH